MVVTVLTGARDRVHDLARVPRTNASNLAKTLVGLARELLGAPTVGDTLETVTLGDGDDVDVLVLLEDRRDLERLLEVRLGELDLVGDGATVDLRAGETRRARRGGRGGVRESVSAADDERRSREREGGRTWISMRCAFFWARPVLRIWVCARTRTTEQYFEMRSSSRATDEAEPDSACFLAYLVNAFFFERYQFL